MLIGLAISLFLVTMTDAVGLLQVRVLSQNPVNGTLCMGPSCKLGKADFTLSADEISKTTFPIMGGAWQTRFNISMDIIKDNGDVSYSSRWEGPAITGENWTSITTEPLMMEFRFVCQDNFYGAQCLHFCQNTDNELLGHFTCGANGEQNCLPGWNGVQCKNAECPAGCGNGTCTAPGVCTCAFGYAGEHCDQCVPGKRCKHGKCYKGIPGTCACDDEWTGPNCDIDRHFCTRHSPCQNGATCLNGKRDASTGRHRRAIEYTCVCPNGFTGKQCERKTTDHICGDGSGHSCLNGGLCLGNGNVTYCRCADGFFGNYCQSRIDNGQLTAVELPPKPQKSQKPVDPCNPSPCKNNGTCVTENGKPRCICPAGFIGHGCSVDVSATITTVTNTGSKGSKSDWEIVYVLLGCIVLTLTVYLCKYIYSRRQQAMNDRIHEIAVSTGRSSTTVASAVYKICTDGSVLMDAPPPYSEVGEKMVWKEKDAYSTRLCSKDASVV